MTTIKLILTIALALSLLGCGEGLLDKKGDEESKDDNKTNTQSLASEVQIAYLRNCVLYLGQISGEEFSTVEIENTTGSSGTCPETPLSLVRNSNISTITRVPW